MYNSPLTKNMKDLKFPQIRLGLQGEPGTGKTYSCRTFPNLVVWDRDNSLTAFAGQDIPVFPLWSDEFISSLNGGKWKSPSKAGLPLNRKDAFKWLLENEATKYEQGQTLFIDSWTAIQDDFDIEQWAYPRFTKLKGEIDDYYPWQEKIKYSKALINQLMKLRCHVVVTFHELKVRDKITGQLLDKVAPLMQGQFTAQLKKGFTDFFRTLFIQDKGYIWQVKADNKFDPKTRLTQLPTDSIYVEPSFSIFEKYGYSPEKTDSDTQAKAS